MKVFNYKGRGMKGNGAAAEARTDTVPTYISDLAQFTSPSKLNEGPRTVHSAHSSGFTGYKKQSQA